MEGSPGKRAHRGVETRVFFSPSLPASRQHANRPVLPLLWMLCAYIGGDRLRLVRTSWAGGRGLLPRLHVWALFFFFVANLGWCVEALIVTGPALSSSSRAAVAPFHFVWLRFANDHGFDPSDPLPEFPHGPLSVYEKGVISERERNKWLDQRIESAKRREMQDCASPPQSPWPADPAARNACSDPACCLR